MIGNNLKKMKRSLNIEKKVVYEGGEREGNVHW
jgi:hypothetical protein